MAGPDLTVARQQVSNLMDDAVTFARDIKGAQDATLDPETGALVGPGTGDVVALYAGPCIITPKEGGHYVVGVPWDAGDFERGDFGTCTAPLRDATLVGRIFDVVEVPHQTYLVVRQLRCTLREVT